jgi:hypothetical protein
MVLEDLNLQLLQQIQYLPVLLVDLLLEDQLNLEIPVLPEVLLVLEDQLLVVLVDLLHLEDLEHQLLLETQIDLPHHQKWYRFQ